MDNTQAAGGGRRVGKQPDRVEHTSNAWCRSLGGLPMAIRCKPIVQKRLAVFNKTNQIIV
jgi:hypothetical protein